MVRLHTIFTLLTGFLLSLTMLSPLEAADVYAKATYAGKAHGPGCGNGFTDIKGQCWVCPKGYKHNNILLPPTNGKVCKKDGGRINQKGIEVGKSIVGICKKGWLSTNNGKCYVCPKGYKHNITKFGTTSGVCYKDRPDAYSSARKQGGSLFCNKGFFDPISGGSCWTCPAKSPKRTLHSVKSDKACVSASCGTQGGRPCLITERFPSCNKGLIEDFVHNKCVSINLKETVCKGLMSALNSGKLPKSFLEVAKTSKSKTRSKSVNNQQLLDQIARDITPHKGKIPEIKRIYSVMNSKKNQVKALFDPATFCSPSTLNRKLIALNLKPNFKSASNSFSFFRTANASTDHFYMAYTLTGSVAVGLGLQVGYTIVTDYRGNAGSYIFLGPQLITNATGGASVGVQFFPKVNLSDFEGWGFGVGVSGGPPSKIVSAGVDVAFSEKFKFQGFGISGGIGLGYIPGDIGIAATHSWKMD